MRNIYACAVLLLLGYLQEVAGNGRMIIPPQRSSLWRDRTQWGNFRLPRNYDDHTLDCGGIWKRDMYDGKCGVCGDPWDAPEPRPNEAGGIYARGIIARKYTTDVRYIDVEIEVTSSMLGYFEFNICANNDVNHRVTEECLSENPMVVLSKDRVVTYGRQYYPDIRPGGAGVVQLLLEIPKGLECTQCVLRWRWRGGNNYGICRTGGWGKGCGKQTEIYNCADISILPPENGQKTTKEAIKTTTASSTTTKTQTTTTASPTTTTIPSTTTVPPTTSTQDVTTPEEITAPMKTTQTEAVSTEETTTEEPVTTPKIITPDAEITSTESITTIAKNTTPESTTASESSTTKVEITTSAEDTTTPSVTSTETVTSTEKETSTEGVKTTVATTTEETPVPEPGPEPTPKDQFPDNTTTEIPIVTSTLVNETTRDDVTKEVPTYNTTLISPTTVVTPLANMTESSEATETTKTDSTSSMMSLSTTTTSIPENNTNVTPASETNITEVSTTKSPVTVNYTGNMTVETTQIPNITALPNNDVSTSTSMSEQTTVSKMATHPSVLTFVPIANVTDGPVNSMTTKAPTDTTINLDANDSDNQSSTDAPITTPSTLDNITETQTTEINKVNVTDATTDATSKAEDSATADTVTSAKPFVDGSTLSSTVSAGTATPIVTSTASSSSNVTVNVTTPTVSSTTSTIADSTIFDIDLNIPDFQPVDPF